MPGLFDVLGSASTALSAQQRGALVTGHNIANVSTPGFHRQELLLAAWPTPQSGVQVLGLRRAREALLEGQLAEQDGLKAFAEQRHATLAALEDRLAPYGENGLGEALQRFFAGWRELGAAPHESALRRDVLDRTDRLADLLRDASGALAEHRAAADRGVRDSIGEVNRLIDTVSELNRGVALAEAGGEPALDLRDQRDLAVRQLAALADGRAVEQADGSVTVLLADGVAVVDGVVPRHLSAELDAASGVHRLWVEGGARVEITGRVTGGRLGALLVVRDQDLPPQAAALDQLAFDLASAVNAQHRLGFGLDGVGGRDLFVQPTAVAGAAAALAVEPSVRAAPDQLAAALDPAGVPGDGRGADALAALADALIAGGGGATVAQALTSWSGDLGLAVRRAESEAAVQLERTTQLGELWESAHGVSLEEQMMMMTRYQRAMQAAARVVQTVDEMLDELVHL